MGGKRLAGRARRLAPHAQHHHCWYVDEPVAEEPERADRPLVLHSAAPKKGHQPGPPETPAEITRETISGSGGALGAQELRQPRVPDHGPRRQQPDRRSERVPAVSMRQLLEAGVHFGHQTRRWNPKMRPFIFAERNGIHIIDLAQTARRLDVALDFVRDTVARGDSVLFVGTKKQAQEPIAL